MDEHYENPVTPLDLVLYAIDLAHKNKTIDEIERSKAISFAKNACAACQLLIKQQTGPTNCSPLCTAKDALVDF